MYAMHSDATYAWFCPVCCFKIKASSAKDGTPIVRPHVDRRLPKKSP